MNNITYSQFGQDLWVIDRYPINNGYFVDIGCGDPFNINNTYLLELNGWKGIAVDANLQDYSSRKNTIFYQELIFDRSNLELEFISHGVLSGIVDTINRYKQILKHKDKISKLKTRTLYDILQEASAPKFINYLSLDTEGSEFNILSTFPFNEYIFGCITVEHNNIIRQKNKIQELLEYNGYVLEKTFQCDDFYYNKNIA